MILILAVIFSPAFSNFIGDIIRNKRVSNDQKEINKQRQLELNALDQGNLGAAQVARDRVNVKSELI